MPEKQEDIFNKANLPSVKFYKMLNHDTLVLQPKYWSYCSTFSGRFDNFDKIKELCSKYVGYLKEQAEIRRQYAYNGEYCNMLSYWVSDVLLKNLEKDQSKCTLAFDEIRKMWSKASHKNTRSYECQPYSSVVNYYQDWENAKKLYDYYIDFNYIDNMASNCAHNCDELCRYLKEVNNTYKSFKESCSNAIKTLCPVINYEAYNPMSLLNKHKSCTQPHVLDMGEAQASQAETEVLPEPEVPPELEEPSDVPSITIGYQEESNIKKDESKPLNTFGNTLLGLLLSSMLFGVLYKVNENYINLYNVSYPSKSIQHISICNSLIYCTCALLFINLQVYTHR